MKEAKEYIQNSSSKNNIVVLSTASPYKFACDVLKVVGNAKVNDAFKASDILSEVSAMPVPEQILELKNKEKRFNKVVDKRKTIEAVYEFISK